MATFLAWCFALPVVIALAAASMILHGWVLSILWSWFIVPTFGLPALSVPTAIGVATVAALATHQQARPKDDSSGAMWRFVGSQLLGPFFVLALAWIVKGFM